MGFKILFLYNLYILFYLQMQNNNKKLVFFDSDDREAELDQAPSDTMEKLPHLANRKSKSHKRRLTLHDRVTLFFDQFYAIIFQVLNI